MIAELAPLRKTDAALSFAGGNSFPSFDHAVDAGRQAEPRTIGVLNASK